MKLTKILLTIFVVQLSCSPRTTLVGNYSAKGKDYTYSLQLNEDKTFLFTQRYIEVKSSCEGNWEVIKSDTLLLKCFPAEQFEELQGGYMSDRERKVVVINNRRLKINDVLLKLDK